MRFKFSKGERSRDSIIGVRFEPNPTGPIYIVQEPLWEISQG
jgi:hypothetical protein